MFFLGGRGGWGRKVRFDRMPNIGGVIKEMVVLEVWLPFAWLFEGMS